jgi:hypothetical protein
MNNFEINFDDGESMIVNGACNLHPLSHFKLPVGTTAQRPSSPFTGMIRFNSELLQVEVWNGSSWLQIVRASAGGNNGSTPDKAAANVQELMDAGVAADGNYYMNIDGTTRRYFVPINSHPYYILIGNWGGGAPVFFSNAGALTGQNLNDQGDTTPTGNFDYNSTWGFFRNVSGSDYRHATFSNRGITYRYVKMRMNLYNYYSNDGVNGRNFLNISSGVGDGLTIMRNNSGAGDGQHIFTYYTAISNNDGNSCPSVAGTQPTHVAGGNNPGGFMGNRYTCFSRSGNSYTSEYVRNFSAQAGDNNGGTGPNVFNGDAWFTVDLGQSYTDDMHIVIHSDQDSGNEDTYLKRGCVLVRPA